jgi:hypothetical protein
MARIATSKMVRVTDKSPHHVGECGLVEFYGTGPSEGVVVLCTSRDSTGASTYIAVDENHIALLQSDDVEYW